MMAQGAEKRVGQRQAPPGILRLLVRFPVLRRQPHPLLAHFSIVFMLATSFFSVCYVVTRDESCNDTAFYCLVAGVVFLPLTILTGMFTHWLNFPGELHGTVGIEKRLSALLLAVAAAALAWRWTNPRVLADLQGLGLIYFLLVLALTPLVTATSYFGGMVTFPLGAPPPAIWFQESSEGRGAPGKKPGGAVDVPSRP